MQKKAKEQGVESGYENTEEGKKKFSTNVKDGNITLGMQHPTIKNFCYGDCGFQYGKLWRNWEADPYIEGNTDGLLFCYIAYDKIVDQLKDLIYGLKNSPEGRRHIITAWRPDTLNDMALNACHNLVQFNCRPIPWETKLEMAKSHPNIEMENLAITEAAGGNPNYGPIPQYYLDCQMYQRSADTFLGVPYNIASYALLTHILCEVLNMIPGDFIHTFGDVHIYDNHLESIKEQLERTPSALPKLEINSEFWNTENSLGTDVEAFLSNLQNEDFLQNLIKNDIKVLDYNPQGRIEGKLSTGLV
jgi:thymidylate synthase